RDVSARKREPTGRAKARPMTGSASAIRDPYSGASLLAQWADAYNNNNERRRLWSPLSRDDTELHLQRHGNRHVVGRPLPAARVAGDPEIADALFKGARAPDVVEPPAAIRQRPVGGTITPPGVDLFRQ